MVVGLVAAIVRVGIASKTIPNGIMDTVGTKDIGPTVNFTTSVTFSTEITTTPC